VQVIKVAVAVAAAVAALQSVQHFCPPVLAQAARQHVCAPVVVSVACLLKSGPDLSELDGLGRFCTKQNPSYTLTTGVTGSVCRSNLFSAVDPY
jgi:hypothetical protein